MKKVLYVTTVSRTINAFLIPHIEMLIKNGFKVDCASKLDKVIDIKLMRKGVKFYEVPFSRNPLSTGNIKAFFKLCDIQRINNYDAIHVHTPIAGIYTRLLKLKFPDVKIIYTAHGYHFMKKGSFMGWLLYYPIEKVIANFTDVIININNEDYEVTKNKINPERCYLINGVGLDLKKYRELSPVDIRNKKLELNLKVKDFVIVMIAEINKNKNHIQLIKAMSKLNRVYPDIKVLCVGEGNELPKLKKIIKKKGLENNIEFLGFRTDINELINISDIGILLSYREGLPRNIMEFIACNKKVIATDIRGCRDIIINDELGTLVDVGDYKATARAIEKSYLERENINDLSEYSKKYDINQINNELIDIYTDLLGDERYISGKALYATNK